MVLYLIGLGLELKGISLHGKKILKNVKKVYLENYTVDFPYTKAELEKELKIKVILAGREFVESEKIVDEAKNEDIALLVYGSPLMATTHIALINKADKMRVKYKILHSASIFDAIAETGLQAYKFGKTASLPKWQKNFEPKSFMDVISDNKKIKAHTLLLIDIGLKFDDAVKELKESGFKEEKVIVCSNMGVKSKILYGNLGDIKSERIKPPYCIIIPGEISFSEKEALEKSNL